MAANATTRTTRVARKARSKWGRVNRVGQRRLEGFPGAGAVVQVELAAQTSIRSTGVFNSPDHLINRTVEGKAREAC